VIERGTEPFDETHEQLSRAAAFLHRALRSWRSALSVFVLAGAACAVFLFVRRPMFRSETVILYSAGVRSGDDADRPDVARSVTFRLKEILMSRSSLDVVMREFDLYPELRKTRGPVDAVEELKKSIEFRAPGGDTFSIAFTGASPSEAQAVTARLAEVVIGQDSDLRRKQAMLVSDFLETEKRATEDASRSAELALASFMAAHPRFALDATPLATGAAIRANFGEGAARPAPALAATRTRASTMPRRAPAAASERVSNTSSGHAQSDTPEAAMEEARAKAAFLAARANLTDLATRFTAAHPDVRAAQAELDRATSRLAAATTPAASTDRPSPGSGPGVASTPALAMAMSSVAAVFNPRGTAVSVESAVALPRPVGAAPENDVVALETEWVKLTRETTEARQHEDQVEAALFKAKRAAASETGDHGVEVTMIDPAFLPQTAIPPGRTMVVAIFAGVSLLLAIAGAAVEALLNDRIYGEYDVGPLAPVLVAVPRRAHVSSG
jgi:uncharacterized protein involved in exopolysaccharide biosynthesis